MKNLSLAVTMLILSANAFAAKVKCEDIYRQNWSKFGCKKSSDYVEIQLKNSSEPTRLGSLKLEAKK